MSPFLQAFLLAFKTPKNADTDNLSSYKYTPLATANGNQPQRTRKSISWRSSPSTSSVGDLRLLKLDPGSGSDPIVCSLSNIPISDLPPFEAISYTWGDMNDTRVIICSQKILKITRSLYSALWNLRLRGKPRLLWADAICINQRDFKEKSEQVMIMGQIYSRARRVLIWLGEKDSGYAGELFELIEWLVRQFSDDEIADCASPESLRHVFQSTVQRACDDEMFKSFEWDTFHYLLQNPWFERVWIIQEVVKASEATVIWGKSHLNWTSLCFFCHAMTQSGFISQITSVVSTSDAVRLHNIHLFEILSSAALITILAVTRNFKSTNPRDRLYAIYGLATDQSQHSLHTDYNIDPADLFVKFAVSDILDRKSLRYLCFTSHRSSTLGFNLPSWVPDWTRTSYHVPLTALCGAEVTAGHLSFKASAEVMAKAIVSVDSKILSVCGKAVDQLLVVAKTIIPSQHPRTSSVSDNVRGGVELANDSDKIHRALEKFFKQKANDMRCVFEWLNECCQIASLQPSTTNIDFCASEQGKNFVSTIFCGHTIDNVPLDPESVNSYGKALASLHQRAKIISSFDSASDMPTLATILDELQSMSEASDIDLLEPRIASRRFCRTRDGRLAWAPFESRPDDLVCVLFGSNMPLILRPANSGCYEVIGECYVHGIMSGEAVNDTSIETRTFHIV